MNVGDYVRTKDGVIAKITDIIEDLSIDCDRDVFDLDNMAMMEIPWNFKDKYIIKSSPQIIDLIEIGDYVNGFYVINKPFNNRIHTEFDDFLEEDIETVLTHEQMETMQYRVEE